MNQVRTVSDTKRDFYQYHTRPVNSIYRRVVEEILVEMHLLSVNVDFRYDPIYALGVVTSFDQFMQGYQPEADKNSIFSAICRAVGGEPEGYRHDAAGILGLAKQFSGTDLLDCFTQKHPPAGDTALWQKLGAIAERSKFKYSRLFANGLYTFLNESEPDLLKSEEDGPTLLEKISVALALPDEKLKKDLEIYRGNLEKISQVLEAIKDTIQADRKRREQKQQDTVEAIDG